VFEFELFDFGIPVDIQPPPPELVEQTPFAQPSEWTTAIEGRSGDVTWRVVTGTIEKGMCIAVEREPVSDLYLGMLGNSEGRIETGCSVAAYTEATTASDGGPVESSISYGPVDIEASAYALADGSALLIDDVPADTTEVELRLRGGGSKSVTPTNGLFAAVLGHDEVVEKIVYVGAAEPNECVLERDYGYECDPEMLGITRSTTASGSDSGSASVPAPTTTTPP
jgi:hypothetical protein